MGTVGKETEIRGTQAALGQQTRICSNILVSRFLEITVRWKENQGS